MKAFLSQFIAGCKCKKPSTYLFTLKQRQTESLGDYIIRFNHEKLTVDDPKEDLVFAALLNGILARGLLMRDLAQRTVASLSKLMNKIEEFINAEDTMKALLESRQVPETESRGKRKDNREEGRKIPYKVTKKMEVVVPLRMIAPQGEPIYNRLNSSIARIFMEIREDPELTWQPKMLTPANRRSRNRYCEFHNDHGHNTEECVNLRFEIGKMIKNEKLIRFLADQQQQRPRQEWNPPRDRYPPRNN
ncbi:uncharacterized protein LOC133878977 [Alnus glutinosa]|uniref:uncharacterized protein LOC133878977 n=1 Tax=Alnus glutinosa TaxID=3517 RepID=UPI002D77F42E|nr:uncharacterized protein LOC133878977 [Alnus glutinosa]